MRTIGRRAAITLFAGSIAAGLTFGVSSALAAPAAAGDCPIQPSEFLGRCTSGVEACTRMCQMYNPSAIGACPSGCCICMSPAP